ncbi:MAG: hypothetical protein HRU70_14545 [Phycisphaeraceae bacterium]|nr:MAG: hypothetical protein HRU70_14545 [Phycisphaeraceae bacterium]
MDHATPESGAPESGVLADLRNRFDRGDPDAAIAEARALAGRFPGSWQAWELLAYMVMWRGQALHDTGMMEEAVGLQRRAVEAAPTNGRSRQVLINYLGMHRLVDEAMDQASAWVTFDGDNPSAHLAFAGACLDCLEFDRARAALTEMVARWPDDLAIADFACNFANYDPSVSPAERTAVQRSFGDRLERLLPPATARHTNPRDPERKLRVGFVSGDFRLHSCAFFLLPLLTNLDRDLYEPFLYYTYPVEDAYVKRFRGLSKRFVKSIPNVAGVTEGLGFKFWNDRLDVLFDLAGHTPGHRLHVFHAKNVPVQVNYLGYPSTTGVPAVGYRFVDSTTDPPGSEPLATEELVRLDPCFVCYGPPEEAPAVEPRPAEGPPVFCSFNTNVKMNDPTIRLWGRVLAAVPGSTLVLKNSGYVQPRMRAVVERKFAAAGVDPLRLVLVPGEPGLASHLAWYNRVDVALDPLHYNGTTTTCEAMWMGVPVVTRRGDCHAGRVGASLLGAVGLGGLIAGTDDEYVEAARALVADRAGLRDVKASLRGRMASGPLCDGAGFARRFEGAVRGLWRRWCASSG